MNNQIGNGLLATDVMGDKLVVGDSYLYGNKKITITGGQLQNPKEINSSYYVYYNLEHGRVEHRFVALPFMSLNKVTYLTEFQKI